METEIKRGRWWALDDLYGRTYVPESLVKDFDDLMSWSRGLVIQNAKIIEGVGIRWVFSGYEDVTAWLVFKDEEEAQKYLQESPCATWEDALRRTHEGPSET